MKPYLEKNLNGLVVLNNTKFSAYGMNKSIICSSSYLKTHSIELTFFSSGYLSFWISVFKNIFLCKIYATDFVVFNSLAAFSRPIGLILLHLFCQLRIPCLIYWHETDWVIERFKSQNPYLFRSLENVLLNYEVQHLVASECCNKSILKYFKANGIVVYEAIPTSIISQAEAKSSVVAHKNEKIVVNIASIQERKGTDLFVETAIKVCAQMEDVKFIWAGSGERFGDWAENIKLNGLEKQILFPGYVEDTSSLLNAASLFFLSSRDDPFPLAVLEAMAFGKKIVTFDVGGAPEALDHGGTLIPPFDTDAAASAILEYFKTPDESTSHAYLQQRCQNMFTCERLAERLNKAIRERINS